MHEWKKDIITHIRWSTVTWSVPGHSLVPIEKLGMGLGTRLPGQ